MNPNFIPLESIQIATPCRADWNAMQGNDRARHCQSCDKNVYNFSAMTREEAQRLILEKEGHLCVRLHRRTDGTIITSDCPVGISPVKKSAGAVKMMLAGAMAAILGIFGVQNARASRMGDVATTGAPMATGTTGTTGMAVMGKPAQPPAMIMGEMVAPTPSPKPLPKPTAKPGGKSVKMPVKSNGNRASRKSSSKPKVRSAKSLINR